MAKKHTRIQPVEPTVNAGEYYHKPVGPNGTRVKITKGQVPDEDGTTTIGNATGKTARIDGSQYPQPSGPNKGRMMQPVKVEGTNDLLAVPAGNLQREGGSKSRGNFTTGIRSKDHHERIFGKKRKTKWVEVRPGVKQLVS